MIMGCLEEKPLEVGSLLCFIEEKNLIGPFVVTKSTRFPESSSPRPHERLVTIKDLKTHAVGERYSSLWLEKIN